MAQGPYEHRPVTSVEVALEVEKLERKLDRLLKDTEALRDDIEGMRQWSTWAVRLMLGAVLTLLITSGVSLLLQR